jgi:glycosyltransferase involved in cell wall biosynthesis
MSERLSTWFPNAVISDARSIAQYYLSRYGKDTAFIPYGAATGKVVGTGALRKLGLEPGRYFLYVSRMEPENNALLVREAFERLSTEMKLALIGDAPYSADYIAKVRDTRDPRIVIPGAIYGEGYHELQSHCFAYVHATEVGGTHPALIEAMGRGALTLYLENDENDEVAGGAAIPFSAETLGRRMQELLDMSDAGREQWREQAARRIAERYSWESVTDAYEALLRGLIERR